MQDNTADSSTVPLVKRSDAEIWHLSNEEILRAHRAHMQSSLYQHYDITLERDAAEQKFTFVLTCRVAPPETHAPLKRARDKWSQGPSNFLRSAVKCDKRRAAAAASGGGRAAAATGSGSAELQADEPMQAGASSNALAGPSSIPFDFSSASTGPVASTSSHLAPRTADLRSYDSVNRLDPSLLLRPSPSGPTAQEGSSSADAVTPEEEASIRGLLLAIQLPLVPAFSTPQLIPSLPRLQMFFAQRIREQLAVILSKQKGHLIIEPPPVKERGVLAISLVFVDIDHQERAPRRLLLSYLPVEVFDIPAILGHVENTMCCFEMRASRQILSLVVPEDEGGNGELGQRLLATLGLPKWALVRCRAQRAQRSVDALLKPYFGIPVPAAATMPPGQDSEEPPRKRPRLASGASASGTGTRDWRHCAPTVVETLMALEEAAMKSNLARSRDGLNPELVVRDSARAESEAEAVNLVLARAWEEVSSAAAAAGAEPPTVEAEDEDLATVSKVVAFSRYLVHHPSEGYAFRQIQCVLFGSPTVEDTFLPPLMSRGAPLTAVMHALSSHNQFSPAIRRFVGAAAVVGENGAPPEDRKAFVLSKRQEGIIWDLTKFKRCIDAMAVVLVQPTPLLHHSTQTFRAFDSLLAEVDEDPDSTIKVGVKAARSILRSSTGDGGHQSQDDFFDFACTLFDATSPQPVDRSPLTEAYITLLRETWRLSYQPHYAPQEFMSTDDLFTSYLEAREIGPVLSATSGVATLEDNEPVGWWLAHHGPESPLARMAIDFLSVPATICASPRNFSGGALALSPLQTWQDPLLVSCKVTLATWLEEETKTWLGLEEPGKLVKDVAMVLR